MSYWSRSFQGITECLSEVRQFTAAVLGDRPGVDLVVLAASELAGNAILHTASGDPGGQFVVHLAAFADRWQVRVDDAGGADFPRVSCVLPTDPADPTDQAGSGGGRDGAGGVGVEGVEGVEVDDLAETGRGLALVAAISRSWGVLGDEYARAVWAEIRHPLPETTAATAAQEKVSADVG